MPRTISPGMAKNGSFTPPGEQSQPVNNKVKLPASRTAGTAQPSASESRVSNMMNLQTQNNPVREVGAGGTNPGVGQAQTNPGGAASNGTDLAAFNKSMTEGNPAMAQMQQFFDDLLADQDKDFAGQRDELRQDAAYQRNKAASVAGRMGGAMGSSFLAAQRQADIGSQQQMRQQMLDQGDRKRQVQLAMLDNNITEMRRQEDRSNFLSDREYGRQREDQLYARGREDYLTDQARQREEYLQDEARGREQFKEDRSYAEQQNYNQMVTEALMSGDAEAVQAAIDASISFGYDMPEELIAMAENLGQPIDWGEMSHLERQQLLQDDPTLKGEYNIYQAKEADKAFAAAQNENYDVFEKWGAEPSEEGIKDLINQVKKYSPNKQHFKSGINDFKALELSLQQARYHDNIREQMFGPGYTTEDVAELSAAVAAMEKAYAKQQSKHGQVSRDTKAAGEVF